MLLITTIYSQIACTYILEQLFTMVNLLQLRDADDDDKKDNFLTTFADHLLDIGITNVYQLVRHEKASLIHIIQKHYIYYR